MGKKSTPAQPAAPDPVATTQAAITQANLNRINQVTPNGSITYSQNGTNSDGTPQYTQTQTYSPDQQALYDQQNQIAQSLGGLAQDNIGRVAQTQGQDFNFNSETPLQTSVTPGSVQSGYASGGNINTSIPGAGQVQSDLGFNNLSAINGNFDQTVKAASDASYQQAASRLDPQFNQEQSDITAKLANQGIAVGSDAYNREMTNFNNTKTDAYNQAQLSAQNAGLAAQAQGYGQSLSTRQQGASEASTQGNFANQAQGQIFGQNAQNAQFGNDAQSQQTSQNASQAAFANTAQNQQFSQGTSNAQLNNAGRQQQIDEASYLRNLPLNDIAALLGTGGGVQNPTFNSVSQVGVAAPDYQGAVYANYNAANQQYNAAQQAQSQGLGSIFGALGSIGAAAIPFSDMRLKTNIKRIGTLANGLPTYTFNYIWNNIVQFGVMAQEVLSTIPDAIVNDNGYMRVNYGKIW